MKCSCFRLPLVKLTVDETLDLGQLTLVCSVKEAHGIIKCKVLHTTFPLLIVMVALPAEALAILRQVEALCVEIHALL
ncbi:hypothetical protein D3C76_1577100 [compost metagenome]